MSLRKHSKSLFWLGLAVLICLTGWLSLKPPSWLRGRRAPRFTGRLILQSSHRLYNLNLSPEGRILDSIIADHVNSAAVSPDKRYLIYSRENIEPTLGPPPADAGETLLRDLTSGAETKLFAYHVSGLNWSPDSQRFSFRHLHELYVTTLAGESQLVYTEPSQTYQRFGIPITPVFAVSSEAIWVGRDRLVFQTGRDFADRVSTGSGPVPHLTTLVLLGKDVKLIDVPRRWYVGARCAAEPFIVFAQDAVSERRGGGAYEFKVRGPLFLARDFVDFEKTELRPLSIQNANFMPRSCRLYSIIVDDSSGRANLKFIDPSTLKTEDGPSLSGGRHVWSSLGDPDEKTIALSYSMSDKDDLVKFGLSIVDLTTGGETELLSPAYASGRDLASGPELRANLRDLKLLAWLSQ